MQGKRSVGRLALVYGSAMAAGTFALQWLENHYAVNLFSTEFYVVALAVFFTLLRIWIGNRLSGRPAAPGKCPRRRHQLRSGFSRGHQHHAGRKRCLVAVWEVYLALTDYKFMEDYITWAREARAQQGLSETELAAANAELDKMQAQYFNPVYRLPLTFLEIFPVGLLVSLIGAALLRNHRSAGA